jgi:5-methylcytosine-specific restriction endonuclease McrA
MKRSPLTRRTGLRRRSKKHAAAEVVLAHNRQVRLEIDGFRCARCRAGWVPLHCHHVSPRSGGVDHSVANLKTLCRSCHAWVHSNPLAAEAEGYLRRRRAA